MNLFKRFLQPKLLLLLIGVFSFGFPGPVSSFFGLFDIPLWALPLIWIYSLRYWIIAALVLSIIIFIALKRIFKRRKVALPIAVFIALSLIFFGPAIKSAVINWKIGRSVELVDFYEEPIVDVESGKFRTLRLTYSIKSKKSQKIQPWGADIQYNFGRTLGREAVFVGGSRKAEDFIAGETKTFVVETRPIYFSLTEIQEPQSFIVILEFLINGTRFIAFTGDKKFDPLAVIVFTDSRLKTSPYAADDFIFVEEQTP